MKLLCVSFLFAACIILASAANAGAGVSVEVYGGGPYVESYYTLPMVVYTRPPVVYYEPPQMVEYYRYYESTGTGCYNAYYEEVDCQPRHRHKHRRHRDQQ